MLTQHYSAQQRRALNQIWNAAGAYGFDPLFLALKQDGSPDLYMNCIVGCVRKWFGSEMPRTLFGAWAGDRRQAMLDDLAWLALESAVFPLESPRRPALAELLLPRSTSCPVRNGWPKTSWSTPSRPPGGGRCWTAGRR